MNKIMRPNVVCRLSSIIAPYIHSCHIHSYVPKHSPVFQQDVNKFVNFLEQFSPALILTGAGVSTESGIPDYRSEGVGLYNRSNYRPVIYKDFLENYLLRRRYWARNYAGWPKFSSAIPNRTHTGLKTLQDHGFVSWIITQNVDHLHSKAGSVDVIELHGTAYKVICLSCNYMTGRNKFQERLEELNPVKWSGNEINPDGDVVVPETYSNNFTVPDCPQCNGILKPDIIFFGDNVPKGRVEFVKSLVGDCKAIVALGSSLTVFSSYRIILQAHELKKPIFLINIGSTRADKLADEKIDVRCGELLQKCIPNIIKCPSYNEQEKCDF